MGSTALAEVPAVEVDIVEAGMVDILDDLSLKTKKRHDMSSRTRNAQPHVSGYMTIQPKKNCIPDQHIYVKSKQMLDEYAYNKRPRYDMNVNKTADAAQKSLGLVQVMEPTFEECYTKPRWTRLQTRRHTRTNLSDQDWSSFMPLQVRNFIEEDMVAPDEGENVMYNGRILIGGQGADTRTYPETN